MGRGHDVEAVASGPAQGLRRVTGHPHARARLLHWPRVDRHVLEVPELALVREAVSRPGLGDDLSMLRESLAGLLPRDTEDGVIARRVPQAHAELQPIL